MHATGLQLQSTAGKWQDSKAMQLTVQHGIDAYDSGFIIIIKST